MEPASFLTRRTLSRFPHGRGFTLVEMLVVLAIIAIITAVVITGQSNYNKTLLLTDTSYGVALSAREAQTFGLASRKYGSVQNPGYGLHFGTDSLNSYTLFADTNNGLVAPSNCPLGTPGTPEQKPGNCRFDSGNDGVVSVSTFSRGFTISQFCGMSGLTKYCSTDAAPLTTLDLVFTRPNTTTTISGLLNGSSLMSFTCAEITLTDSTGQASRTIRLSSIGEISVNQNCSGTQAPTQTWTKCADEWGTCVVSGTARVRYGAGSSWFYQSVTGSIGCNNSVWGDPIPGTVKECDVSS